MLLDKTGNRFKRVSVQEKSLSLRARLARGWVGLWENLLSCSASGSHL